MRTLLACVCGVLWIVSTGTAAELDTGYPQVTISNGQVTASVFVPDAEKGFYRGTRFEWSGMVWQLTHDGHTYFAQRKFPHDPDDPGHGMSLAEEFCIGTSLKIPQRYAEAEPGGTFIKIGVGSLVKPEDEESYRFQTAYDVDDGGTWSWDHGENWVSFTHTLADTHGLAYTYTKRMELIPGTSTLEIRHWLTNTGRIALSADQYNHNFFTIDHEPVGPGYEIQLFFPGMTPSNWEPRATFEDNRITINQPIEEALFGKFSGMTGAVSDNHVIIRHTGAGAGVEITGDFPVSGFNFYASSITVCPELFILLEIAPGETKQWTRTYRFFSE